jgi:hypothetical protein
MSAQSDLQAEIEALVKFAEKPAADWVARVRSAPDEVIAGAILSWRPTGGLNGMTGDPMEPRRSAARALLQSRLSGQSVKASDHLRMTIDEYQRKSGRQTTVMLWLTVAIAVLTVAQIWIAVRAAPGVESIRSQNSRPLAAAPLQQKLAPAECSLATSASICADILQRSGKNPFDAFDYGGPWPPPATVK